MYFESLAGCLGYIPMAVVATIVVAVLLLASMGFRFQKYCPYFTEG